MRRPLARVGDPVSAIDTPALVVELEAFEHNLDAMASFVARHGLRLRPHAKTHKCARIAQLQVERGAVGVCVQKVGEAEALVASGVRDVFVSNEVIAPAKLARLAALAHEARIAIAVDSRTGIERLAHAAQQAAATIEVFVEVDVGQGRCGVAATEAGALARQTVAHDGLRFAGLHAYQGRAQHLRTPPERAAAIRHAVARAQAARAAVTADGVACPLVTGGGTGSFALEADSGVYGELQPGSYVFMDADYARNTPDPRAPRFESALFVKAQVISAGLAHVVLDAGHKSHAIESGLPSVYGHDGLQVVSVHDEHATLQARGPGVSLPALGDTVWLQPGHCDPTVNLHDHLIAVRGGLDAGIVEAVWAVDARGACD